MGQVASLFEINKFALSEIKKNLKFEYGSELNSLYVDKLWEPIMLIMSNGFLGKAPFEGLFMPPNRINIDPTTEWGESINYHDANSISILNLELSKISENDLRERIDIQKINQVVMYPIVEEQIDSLIDHALQTIKFYKNVENNGNLIIGEIG